MHHPADRPPSPPASWRDRVIHEDDEFLVVHSVRTPRADLIVVTFDPLTVTAERPAYAADFLRKEQVDALAVRKKRENMYQPMSRERFGELAAPVLRRYRRSLAYGSSLGAYAALYFCAGMVDHVIASSPRVPAHPHFGGPRWQREVPFLHAGFDGQVHGAGQASILYDPVDWLDGPYVETEILPALPRARTWAIRHSGHPANHFLSEIGFIAPFVRSVIAGTAPPPLDRARRKTSAIYLRVLATHCLRRGKPRWARTLASRAFEMNPRSAPALRARIQAELALDHLDEAAQLIDRYLTLFESQRRHIEASHRELHRRRAAAQARTGLLGAGRSLLSRLAAALGRGPRR